MRKEEGQILLAEQISDAYLPVVGCVQANSFCVFTSLARCIRTIMMDGGCIHLIVFKLALGKCFLSKWVINAMMFLDWQAWFEHLNELWEKGRTTNTKERGNNASWSFLPGCIFIFMGGKVMQVTFPSPPWRHTRIINLNSWQQNNKIVY